MSKVLIVDDEDRFRTSLARRLKMRGYDTLDVDNGEDGIKLIRSRHRHRRGGSRQEDAEAAGRTGPQGDEGLPSRSCR